MLVPTEEKSLLFIGDSITDCGRSADPDGIGHGYVRIIRDWFFAKDPASAPRVINRGVSGNRVIDLAERWNSDVIDLKPDLLSVEIGINDVWHGLGERNEGVEVDRFEAVYDFLLRQVVECLPRTRIVLCEPSVIWVPAADGNDALRPYIEVIRRLAKEHLAACVVPLHSVFEAAHRARPEVAWAPDGIHPSSTGHMLIARAWLEKTGLL